jgi:predicted HD phosphohydrolase
MSPTTPAIAESFRRMDASTKEDWDYILAESELVVAKTPERIMALLRALQDLTCGFAVDQLVHVTQTATRAERAGADDEMVVASLCHDVGKAINVLNHPAVAADLLEPYVRPEVEWVVRFHQDFEGRHYYGLIGMDPDAREKHRGHPSFDLAAQFADEWDQTSFDPDYDTLPLEHFEPLVHSIFSSPREA